MIIHDCAQNSQEWIDLHIGKVTSSSFTKVITPVKLELSAQSEGLAMQKAGERITGKSEEEFFGNACTERGHIMEEKAVKMYRMINDVDPIPVGFIENDARTFGCSPDMLIGEDGGLEIKSPLAKKHIETLLSGKVPDEHKAQIQGNLWLSGRKWWDFMSYHPEMKPFIQRVERDEEYISALEKALTKLNERIETIVKIVKE